MVKDPTKLQIKFYKIIIRIKMKSPCLIKQNAIKRVSQTFWSQNTFYFVNVHGTRMFCGPLFIKQKPAQQDVNNQMKGSCNNSYMNNVLNNDKNC
jgi:hypothetical protein